MALPFLVRVLQGLEPFYEKFDPDFLSVRTTVRQILQKEDDLNEIVQLVGKVGTSLSQCYISRTA